MKYRNISFWVLVIAVVVSALIAGRAFPQGSAQTLDRPFPYDIDRTEAPLPVLEEFLRDNGLSGGIVLMSDSCEDPPLVHWRAKQGSPFRQVLDDFQAYNPDYRWDLRGNVLNVVPAAGLPPLLAAKIRTFDLHTTDQLTPYPPLRSLLDTSEMRLAATELHLKEGSYTGGLAVARDSSAPPEPPKAPSPIDVHLKNISLQDALNAVAQAYGHVVWWYRQRTCQGQVTYTVEDSQAY
jgi:hypothetical protein